MGQMLVALSHDAETLLKYSDKLIHMSKVLRDISFAQSSKGE